MIGFLRTLGAVGILAIGWMVLFEVFLQAGAVFYQLAVAAGDALVRSAEMAGVDWRNPLPDPMGWLEVHRLSFQAGSLALVAGWLQALFRRNKAFLGDVAEFPVAPPVSGSEPQMLYDEVARLAGIASPPALWVAETQRPLAFTVSLPRRAKGAIVISQGFLNNLPWEASGWILAHELGHYRRGDTAAGSVWMAGARGLTIGQRVRTWTLQRFLQAFTWLPLPLFVHNLLAGLIALLLRLSSTIYRLMVGLYRVPDRFLSRRAEYRADAFATAVMGRAAGETALKAVQGNWESRLPGLLASHPPLRKRIAALSRHEAPSSAST